MITLLFHRAKEWTRKSIYTGHIPHPRSLPRLTPSMESYPSYTLPDQSCQDFTAFVPNTGSLFPFSDRGEPQSGALLEGPERGSDIAMTTAGIYQPQLSTSITEELYTRSVESPPPASELPSVSTPGFIALKASQTSATSARRVRKPREFVPHF